MIKIINPFSARNKKPSFWWLGLKLGLLIALLFWWWMQEDFEDGEGASQDRVELPLDDLEPEDGVFVDRSAIRPELVPDIPDDLTEIDGIGPKYAQVLKAAGVLTFLHLAGMHPDDIRGIFQAAGGRVPNPTAWPEGAAQKAAD